MRALIIEPQIFASFMIEDALKDAGYTSIAHAMSEEEALAAAEAAPPDLITAAVKLDGGNGIRAVQKIRSNYDAAVLFITERLAEVRAAAPGIPTLRKPFVAADLPPAIAKAQRRLG